MVVAQRGIITSPGYPLFWVFEMSGHQGFRWDELVKSSCEAYTTALTVSKRGGRVLSPTTNLIPLSIQALMTSALCIPVMAGGMSPFAEKYLADEIPEC